MTSLCKDKISALMLMNVKFFPLFQDWQPPFAVDVDNFTFTPRVQRLNELEVSAFKLCFE